MGNNERNKEMINETEKDEEEEKVKKRKQGD